MSRTSSIGRFRSSEFEKLKSKLVIYRSVLSIIETKLSNLNDYYMAFCDINPIESIKCRIKSAESIAGKLKTKKLPLTAEAASNNLSDIAGARIICSYAKNIAEIADILKAQNDITVISEKDYVTTPKQSGYRSYHMVVNVNLGNPFNDKTCPVEIQIRTAAMDFWASLEHKVRYKYSGEIPEHLSHELQVCAERIHELDERMYLIHDLVELINE